MPFSYTSCTDLNSSRSRTRTAQLGCVCTNNKKLVGPVVPCTPGVRLWDRSRMFTRRWSTMYSEQQFRTPPVQICTAPLSRTGTMDLDYVYTTCTKLGGPVDPCTTGVWFQDRSRMFTRPWQTICSELQVRTPPVRICTAPRNQTRTAHLGNVYTTCTKLGAPIGPCTTNVRLPDRSRMFTRPCQTICSERHFQTAPVRICAATRNGTQTAQLGSVCTNYKKLVGPLYLVHQVYDSKTTHGCSPVHGKQSTVKAIFVHLLYGFVRLPEMGLKQLN